MSTQTMIIVGLVAVIGIIVAIGWRAPDRSPGIEDETDRERIEH
jgi:hypothetical protein